MINLRYSGTRPHGHSFAAAQAPGKPPVGKQTTQQGDHRSVFTSNDLIFEQINRELVQTDNPPLQVIYQKLLHNNVDADALEFIGTAFLCGSNGLHADIGKALIFLRPAADCGSTAAQHYVAQCCAFGIGMPKSRDLARRYYRLAAQSTVPSIREAALSQLDSLNQT